MTDVELAWAAGLFEGEGTVRINKPTRRNCGALIVSVCNTDRDVLDWFQARWPGYMKKSTGLDLTRQRQGWVWLIAATKAAAFLTAIRPFVVRRRMIDRIDHALAFQAGKRHGRANRSLGYIADQWAAYWWMCELNQRGPAGEFPPALLASRSDAWRSRR